jgi:acyl-CoA synthetase (NDP forming)
MARKQVALSEIFSPRSVAVVGASTAQAKNVTFGRFAVECLKEAGFPTIYPVNPHYTELLGLPCYPSLLDIPGAVDHVIIAVPASSALPVLDDCAAKGVKSVHIFTAGFGESGDTDRALLERALLNKAESGGFRIIGPNCMGLYIPEKRMITWPGMSKEPGTIALISQSGGFAEDVAYFGIRRGLRFSKVVSYGNGLDIDETELLHYLGQDTETEMIAAYIEGVKVGSRFSDALKEAAARKPVVIYKSGFTPAGRRAAQGHTASLTGSADIFQALCRQVNVMQVDDIDEMLDMLVALHFTKPIPRGNGVAIVGRGGGISVLASDQIEAAGLRLPPLPPKTQTELRQLLPRAGSIYSNPVDANSLLLPEAVASTMLLLSQVPDINLFIYHLGFHPTSRWGNKRFSSAAYLHSITDALKRTRELTGKPVIPVLRPPSELGGAEDFVDVQELLINSGFPVFYSVRQAARAIARLIAWDNNRTGKLGEIFIKESEPS